MEKKFKFLSSFIKRWAAAVSIGLVFLLYLWLFFVGASPTLPSLKSPLVLYSNQCQQDLRLLFTSAIKSAKKTIFLQMYALTDKPILNLLNSKAAEGVFVTLFYDPKASNDIANDPSLYPFAHPVSTDGLMHRKILVVDNALVFIGSANMTPQSLTMHDNIVAGIYHEPLAHFLEKSVSSHYPFSVQGQEAEIWLLPDYDDKAIGRLIELLALAKKNIQIAMFTITHPGLVDALIKAHEKGVEVSIAADYYTAKGASAKTLKRLEEKGIKIFLSQGMQLLHHKWALVDSSVLILGSANWTRSAFSRNQDCFMILNTLTDDQRKFMSRIWKTITLESKK